MPNFDFNDTKFYSKHAVFNGDVSFYGKVYGLSESAVGLSSISYNNSNVTVQTNETVTITTNNVGIVTFTENSISFNTTGIVQQLFENVKVSSSALTGTINLDILTGTLFYYTTNASANWTFDVRGDASNSLNSILPTGKSITITVLTTQGSTPYYANTFKVDGTTITPKWMNGVTPSSGFASSINLYTYVILKTGDATFTVIGSLNRTT